MNKEELERRYVYENYYHRDSKFLTSLQRHWKEPYRHDSNFHKHTGVPEDENFIENEKIKKIENNENTKK